MSLQDQIESLDESTRELLLDNVSHVELWPDDLWQDYLIDMNGDDAIYVKVPGSGLDDIFLGTPAQVLEKNDPVAYRCGMNDFIDAEMKAEKIVDIEGRIFPASEVKKELDSIDTDD